MAVSFTQQPAYATPSDNPIIFQFRQTLSGKYNMSFVVRVFAGGEIGTFEVLGISKRNIKLSFSISEVFTCIYNIMK